MEGTHSSKNCGQSSYGPCVHHVHHTERRPHRHGGQGKAVSTHVSDIYTVFIPVMGNNLLFPSQVKGGGRSEALGPGAETLSSV